MPGMTPSQLSSRPLHTSGVGQTASVEHTYQACDDGSTPAVVKQLVLVLSQPTTVPARHWPTLLPQG